MERIGPYVVHEQLGRGGMGVVFRAIDARSQRQVALKLLTSTDERARRRLQQEAKALGQLQHRNIVSILEVGEDRGRPWLALELVRGRSLQDRLDREGPLSPRDAARLVVAVAQGLDQAHRRGVLHRDLKPGNVLLPDDGSEPKLTDFGLAAFTSGLDQSRLTKTGTLLGSPGYWSPEQASGKTSSVGPPTDVYGLGALLYGALTGRPPIDGESLPELLVAMMQERPTPPGSDPALDAIVMRCLEKRPEDRFPDVAAVAHALWQYLLVPAVSTPRRRAPRALIGAAGATALAAALGGVIFSARRPQAGPAANEPVTPEEPTSPVTPVSPVAPATKVAPVTPEAEAPPPFPISATVRDRLARWVEVLEPEAKAPMLRALISAAEGRPLAEYERSLELAQLAGPRSAEVAHLSALVLAGRDAYDRALEQVARARDLAGRRGPLDLIEGEVLWFQGRGNDAVKVWDALARRAPTSAAGRCAAAWAHYAREEVEPGLAEAGRALREDPELVSALMVEGLLSSWAERLPNAEACFERALALEGALCGRLAVLDVDAELAALIAPVRGKGRSTPQIDARMERLESLFGLCGATARTVAANNAIALGQGTRWLARSKTWLEDAKRREPRRGELDLWLGYVLLNEVEANPELILEHWRSARVKESRIRFPTHMLEQFRRRFGDDPTLTLFDAR